jgi:hypothetical protein
MLGGAMHAVKMTLATLAVLACVAAVVAAFTGTASGATCPSTYACGWVDSGFGTPRGQWAGTNPRFSVFGQPSCQEGNWNDCVSSDANSGTQCTVHFWEHTFYQGIKHNVTRGSFEASLGSLNDKFSSNNWC